MTALIASSTDTDEIGQATPTVSLNGLEGYCSTLLGYGNPDETETIFSGITQTTIMTKGHTGMPTTEVLDVTVESTHVVSYPAHTDMVDPGSIVTSDSTLMNTVQRPNYIATTVLTVPGAQKLRLRGSNDMAIANIPDALRPYNNSALSSVCSSLIGSAAPTSILFATDMSTIVQTSYAIGPVIVYSPTISISEDMTISDGVTVTQTASPPGLQRIRTLTTTVDLSLTTTQLVTQT